MKRTVAWSALGLLVLVALGLAGGGWYYSNELLPAPPPAEPAYDIEVVASQLDGARTAGADDPDELGPTADTPTGTSGTVTLAASEGDLLDLQRLGFETPDGVLELGAITDKSADHVTRTATLQQGRWPEAGDRGSPFVATYRGDPTTSLGLDHTEVPVEGPTGTLPAWRVPGAPDGTFSDGALDGTWVVVVHGRGARKDNGNHVVRSAHDAGLDTLVIAIRNDPDAPADGVGRFGDAEWEDLQAAIDHLRGTEAAERFVLVGSSQGGSIVLSFLRRSPDAGQAVATVLIGPLVSMQATLDQQARQRGVPGPAVGPLLWSTKVVSRLRAGIRFERLEHGDEAVVGTYTVPMLVVQGTGDTSVPPEASVAFAEARPDLVRLELYDEVEHVREWNTDPDRFDRDLLDFLAEHLEDG